MACVEEKEHGCEYSATNKTQPHLVLRNVGMKSGPFFIFIVFSNIRIGDP